jgi:two-component sensor histidine kinase
MTLDDPLRARASFECECEYYFGVTPNFFHSASAAPGLTEELWALFKSAYIGSPLPSLFKERLSVHLARFCEVRYCIVRHVGFLIGEGRPAGDPKARPETIEQVITLLRRPVPDANALAGVFVRLESHEEPGDIPAPGTQAEYDLFDALTVLFLEPLRWGRAREALRRAVGNGTFEVLTAFLAFVRTLHFWTETHPELAIEPEMLSVLEKHDELARLLLDPSEAERMKAGGGGLRDAPARSALLLFKVSFQDRIGALGRVQGLLSRVKENERVTFDELIETELSAQSINVGEDGPVTLDGPRGVPLRSRTVQTLAMVLHELATNAIKYGALKQPNGHLVIRWRQETGEGGKSWLHLDWKESGVEMPPAGTKPKGTGQGRELIERALPYQFDAQTTFAMERDGVHCTISLPALT